MIGWTNLGGRPGCRSSASINASTASAAACAVHARDLGGVRQGGIVAENRQGLRHGPNRWRASSQPVGHEPGHRRRAHGGDRAGVDAQVLSASLLEGRDQLAREQRVPARGSCAFHADLILGVLAEAAANQLGDRHRAERGRPDRPRRFTLDQLRQGFGRGRCLARPDRENRARRDLVDPRLEVGEEPKRLLVGPVRIVDEHGERLLLGQPRAQPVQAVESCEQAIIRSRSVGNLLEQRARKSRGTCKDPFTLAL